VGPEVLVKLKKAICEHCCGERKSQPTRDWIEFEVEKYSQATTKSVEW